MQEIINWRNWKNIEMQRSEKERKWERPRSVDCSSTKMSSCSFLVMLIVLIEYYQCLQSLYQIHARCKKVCSPLMILNEGLRVWGLDFANEAFELGIYSLLAYQYNLFVMQQSVQKTNSLKKTLQQIQKSQYYQNEVFKDVFGEQSKPLQPIKHQNLIFYSASSQSTLDHHFSQEAVRQSCQKTYLSNFQALRLNRDMFKRTVKINKPLALLFGKSEEVLHFHIQATGSKKEKNQKIVLNVVHHCDSESKNNIKWLNFVESYTLEANDFKYVMTAVLKFENTYLGTNKKLFEQFLETTEVLKNASRMEGSLLQYQSQNKLQLSKLTDPAFNTDHKALNHVKPQFVTAYYHLQKQFPEEKQDLICRYLIALEYDIKKTRVAVKEYRQWYDKFTQKFSYEDFTEFHEMRIFEYIGEDRMGRPVIINRAKNVKPYQIDNQKYCNYYLYYLEVYMPSKMRGYISQLLIIADVQSLGAENFKPTVTKRNLDESVKYSPERQYKMIAVNVSSFAMYWWRIMSPLLPKKTLEKVVLVGSENSSIFPCLEVEMDISVIPEYLGGDNPITFA